MGRSQVKYRSTHGRGRGGATGGAEGAPRGGRSGRRPLESNAFRYEAEGEQEDAELDATDASSRSSTSQPRFFRRQFFAGEESVRGPSAAASGSYFQSQTVKQWEADDETDDPSVKNTMGVLVDFEFVPQETSQEEEEQDDESAAADSTSSISSPAVATKPDDELDLLLKLSSTTVSSGTSASSSTATGAPSSGSKPAHTQEQKATDAVATSATTSSPDQLEDWLDDVLDL